MPMHTGVEATCKFVKLFCVVIKWSYMAVTLTIFTAGVIGGVIRTTNSI